jgi:hypothetical protein
MERMKHFSPPRWVATKWWTAEMDLKKANRTEATSGLV